MSSNNQTIDVPASVGEFADSFKRIQTDMSELLTLTKDKARVSMEAFGKTASDTSKRAVECTQDAIVAHPLRSAGIALAAGALIGFLLSRR